MFQPALIRDNVPVCFYFRDGWDNSCKCLKRKWLKSIWVAATRFLFSIENGKVHLKNTINLPGASSEHLAVQLPDHNQGEQYSAQAVI